MIRITPGAAAPDDPESRSMPGGWRLCLLVLRKREGVVTQDQTPGNHRFPPTCTTRSISSWAARVTRDFAAARFRHGCSRASSTIAIQPEQRVLDIVCGRGEAALWLAERGARGWGLDYALPALHIAQDKASQHSSAERVRFIAANARTSAVR